VTITTLPTGACAVTVRSFREGVLAVVGHDLLLDAPPTRVTVDREARTLEAVFDARAVTVRCAVQGGREVPAALSSGDRDKIQRSLADTILVARAHPTITFRGRWEGDPPGVVVLQGELTLRGVTRPLRATANPQGEGFAATWVLRPSDWGIAPFVALLGTLRVRDEVHIEAHMQWPHTSP